MRLRYEPWGAWVKLESMPALVALDQSGVRALGLDGGAKWTAFPRPSAPVEVHLSVTSRCGAGCKGCYLDARPDGDEPSREDLLAALDAMQRAGVFTVAFGGGEPTLRSDLPELAAAALARGITPVLTTSGIGLGPAKIARLRDFAQVNVSYDGGHEAYQAVRGFDGAGEAEEAIRALAREGIRVGVNVVLTRQSFPRLHETVARARELGACEAQLLRYKPSGRARSLDYFAARLSPEQAGALGERLRGLVARHEGKLSIRIDCALVPFLSVDPELAVDAARLAQFGVFGCEAGGALAAVKADGKIAPCSFAGSTDLAATDLAAHEADPTLARWRSYVAAPAEPCASCPLRTVCKGGCKVVADFVSREHGPDPECPRVLAHRSAAACG